MTYLSDVRGRSAAGRKWMAQWIWRQAGSVLPCKRGLKTVTVLPASSWAEAVNWIPAAKNNLAQQPVGSRKGVLLAALVAAPAAVPRGPSWCLLLLAAVRAPSRHRVGMAGPATVWFVKSWPAKVLLAAA